MCVSDNDEDEERDREEIEDTGSDGRVAAVDVNHA
jgi:hypothetical protein